MTPFLKVLSVLAPEFAVRRAAAQHKLRAMMNYDGASLGRRTKGWKVTGSDADAAGLGVRGRLRQLSRDMIRNRPYAKRAIDVVVNNVVGKGIVASIEADDDAVKTNIEALVLSHVNSKDVDAHGVQNLAGLQRVAASTVFESGEVLLRRRKRDINKYDTHLKLPFQVELLEPDFLDESRQSHGGNEIREGIEYDAWGKIVAYWLFEHHPGSATRKIKLTSKRVLAADIIHVRRLDRAGQTRGVPWLAPALLTMGELSDYQEAQILKQKIAAMLVAVIESDASNGQASFEGKDIVGLESLEPGAVAELRPGQKVSFSTPPTVDGYDQFMRQGISAIAMAIGITYESLAGDLSRVNFASGKMGRMEMDRNVEAWQQLIMIDQMCVGIEAWVEQGVLLLNRRLSGRWKMKWTAPRRPLIDANREVKAILEQIKGGLISRQQAQRQLGYDPETVHKERIEDQQKYEAGLPAQNATKTEANP